MVTELGNTVASEINAAVSEIDVELARMLTRSQLDGLRAGLKALQDIDLDRATASWPSLPPPTME